MNKEMDLVIVEMDAINVFGFVNKNETKEEAKSRANKYYCDELELVKGHLKHYGGDYWKSRVESIDKKISAGFKVMSFEDYEKAKREYLINRELTEITADEFEEMLCVLPPIFWVTYNNIEMFCMSEMYTGTYTNQYAHDRNTDKYYTKLVDSADKSTWICELLKETV